MPDTSVKLQDITPVKSTFDSDDQLLLINATGEARISKADFATELGYTANSKAPVITETVTGAIANFPDGADDMPVTSLVANIEPKQSGSGDPSPSNIRPISGWTGCNVKRTGKNLLDGSIKTQNASYVYFNTTGNSSEKTMTLPAGTYTVSVSYTGTVKAHVNVYRMSPYERIAVAYNATKLTFTLDKTEDILLWMQNANFSISDIASIQIEVGSTATAYEPYITPATASLSWQTEAGTVYGGTIDVATGLLTVTNGYIASYNGETLPSTWISDRDVYSSGTTPTTGAQVVYALATPQTYQLTPQDVYTLLGTNNVWADTGNVSVTYPADTKMFIEKLTMPTEDDLVANQAITSGKYFMVGNSLYLALANIASGAQITIGTNAQRVSLADALNTINA